MSIYISSYARVIDGFSVSTSGVKPYFCDTLSKAQFALKVLQKMYPDRPVVSRKLNVRL